MAETVVSLIAEQLSSILHQAKEGIRPVVGATDEVKKLNSNFLAIKAVLNDAESRQVKQQAVRDWLDKLKDVSYDIDDVLDQWNTTIQKLRIKEVENASEPLRKVSSRVSHYLCCCRQVDFGPDIALRIKKLNRTLDVISMEKNRFNFISSTEGTKKLERSITISILDMSEVFGRDYDKNRLVNLLMSESSQGPNLSIISIVGMGGIGKTTLAQLVFNDEKVKAHFDIEVWVCVSDPFDDIEIAKAILQSLTGVAPNAGELETILQKIGQSISRKRFFLVLDDVWIESIVDSRKWELLKNALECCAPGSRILVTTSEVITAQVLGSTKTNMISLGILPSEACWSLFSQVAFSGRTNDEREILEDIGRKIVEKCNGLPLAVKTFASLLSLKTKVEQWQSVLDSELWEVEGIEEGLFPPLLLSYFDLSCPLRKCFLYCAIFPKDFKLEKEKLINLWMAQDYLKLEGRDDMELVDEERFEYLAMSSFFQDFEKDDDSGSIVSCKMQYIMHDFAQFLTKNECNSVEVNSLGMLQLEFLRSKARHLMMEIKKVNWKYIHSSVNYEIKIHSLVLDYEDDYDFEEGFSKLFNKLTCLRTLELKKRPYYIDEKFKSDEKIPNFPEGINKLIHLRYLNLGGNEKLHELPETLCDLYNLQTLDVSYCGSLEILPQRIGELINPRHLINRGCSLLKYMPKGMKRLTCLRTLSEFVVRSGSEYGENASTLECLSNLKHLQGHLTLRELGQMRDTVGGGDHDEVEVVVELLKSNIELRHLSLEFDYMSADEHEEVLDDILHPPPSLEKLELKYYEGITISPPGMLSLTKLRVLSLEYGKECVRLPCSLAKLPSLESLSFRYMRRVKKVGDGFLGILEEASSSSLSLSSSTIIAFPQLKLLKFVSMYEWEEWSCAIKGENDIKIMPCLLHLEIRLCRRLKELPDYICRSTSLEKLIICKCTKLEDVYENMKAEDWPNISPIPNIQINGRYVRGHA